MSRTEPHTGKHIDSRPQSDIHKSHGARTREAYRYARTCIALSADASTTAIESCKRSRDG